MLALEIAISRRRHSLGSVASLGWHGSRGKSRGNGRLGRCKRSRSIAIVVIEENYGIRAEKEKEREVEKEGEREKEKEDEKERK